MIKGIVHDEKLSQSECRERESQQLARLFDNRIMSKRRMTQYEAIRKSDLDMIIIC